VICLDCWPQMCIIGLNLRTFVFHEESKFYAIRCPCSGPSCSTSFIWSPHMFKLMGPEYYRRYQSIASEDAVLKTGGILCPIPKCPNPAFYPNTTEDAVECASCKKFFCRKCREIYPEECCCEEVKKDEEAKSDEEETPPAIVAPPLVTNLEQDEQPPSMGADTGAPIQIRVDTPRGSVTLDAKTGRTIYYLKTLIADEHDIDMANQKIYYAGAEMKNNQVLNAYQLTQCTVFTLVLRHTPTNITPVKRSGVAPPNPLTQILAQAKQCPRCQNGITKWWKYGCHHVTCRCNYEMCYVCVKAWSGSCQDNHWFCDSDRSCGCPVNPDDPEDNEEDYF